MVKNLYDLQRMVCTGLTCSKCPISNYNLDETCEYECTRFCSNHPQEATRILLLWLIKNNKIKNMNPILEI